MAYRVSFHPLRGWRWWPPDGAHRFGGPYCETGAERHVRDATPEEAALIERIKLCAEHDWAAMGPVARLEALMSDPRTRVP
jgi:hypothetical protein